jgi:hypothetical protein
MRNHYGLLAPKYRQNSLLQEINTEWKEPKEKHCAEVLMEQRRVTLFDTGHSSRKIDRAVNNQREYHAYHQ